MPRKKKEEGKTHYDFVDHLKSSFYDVGGRTKLDRHKEFVNVFMATDEGKRVLYEILGMAKLSARLVPPFPAPIDKDRLLVLEGARQLAADIIDVITITPELNRPTQTNSKK